MDHHSAEERIPTPTMQSEGTEGTSPRMALHGACGDIKQLFGSMDSVDEKLSTPAHGTQAHPTLSLKEEPLIILTYGCKIRIHNDPKAPLLISFTIYILQRRSTDIKLDEHSSPFRLLQSIYLRLERFP